MGVLVHTFNSITWEEVVGGSLSLQAAWYIQKVLRESGLNR